MNPLNWTKSFYNKVMTWAEHPKGSYGLGFIAAIESIFFPLPVDPLLIAMGAARPPKALKFAAITTSFSVLGGILGYFLGWSLWEGMGEFFLNNVFSQEKFQLVMDKFNENGFLAVFLAGFTPIPYKVFTLAAGVAELNLIHFIGGSILGRGIRFFIIGCLLYKFGAPIRVKIEQHFEKLTIALAIVLVLGFIIFKFA